MELKLKKGQRMWLQRPDNDPIEVVTYRCINTCCFAHRALAEILFNGEETWEVIPTNPKQQIEVETLESEVVEVVTASGFIVPLHHLVPAKERKQVQPFNIADWKPDGFAS